MVIQNISTLLSAAQVAQHFGIRPRTVLAWVQQGRLPKPLRIGKAPHWEMQDLEITVDAARVRRDAVTNEPKPRMPPPPPVMSKSYASSKELQMMIALKRAQHGQVGAIASSARRPY